MSKPLLEVHELKVNYGRLTAVHDVSFSAFAGELLCIVGPNGAGKSTTLLAITGAVSAKAGCIRFDGQSILGQRIEDIAMSGVALVPEGRHVFARLTVQENLLLGTHSRRDKAAISADAERMLSMFPALRERLFSPAGRLSGGEQQQLVIGRALMMRPRLLLIDEPSLGLAPIVVDQVYRVLRSLTSEGLALVVVEQSLARAVAVADRIGVLREGHIRRMDAVTEADHTALEQAYFGF